MENDTGKQRKQKKYEDFLGSIVGYDVLELYTIIICDINIKKSYAF